MSLKNTTVFFNPFTSFLNDIIHLLDSFQQLQRLPFRFFSHISVQTVRIHQHFVLIIINNLVYKHTNIGKRHITSHIIFPILHTVYTITDEQSVQLQY